MTAEKYEPQTDEEWQKAVNLAEFYLLLESAREYGLVAGGPKINVDRCSEILVEGESRGFKPQKGCGETIAAALAAGADG